MRALSAEVALWFLTCAECLHCRPQYTCLGLVVVKSSLHQAHALDTLGFGFLLAAPVKRLHRRQV